MEEVSWLRAVWSLLLVVGLIGIAAVMLRRFALGKVRMLPAAGGSRRLELLEVLPIDLKTRLLLIRCDRNEHLLLVSGERAQVVHTSERAEQLS